MEKKKCDVSSCKRRRLNSQTLVLGEIIEETYKYLEI